MIGHVGRSVRNIQIEIYIIFILTVSLFSLAGNVADERRNRLTIDGQVIAIGLCVCLELSVCCQTIFIVLQLPLTPVFIQKFNYPNNIAFLVEYWM